MGKKILLVEDEQDIAQLLSVRLKDRGFEVDSVMDGNEALVKVKECLPDLIVLDIMLPGLGGNEVAAELKEDKVTAHIPIIFLSALHTKDDEASGNAQIGGHVIFAKPYDIDVLVNKINELTG